jgi:hypothetical protein
MGANRNIDWDSAVGQERDVQSDTQTAASFTLLNHAGGKMDQHSVLLRMTDSQFKEVWDAYQSGTRPESLKERVWNMLRDTANWTEGFRLIEHARINRNAAAAKAAT